ncbi:hypothetical protein FOZ76_20120 [Verticiella sediminum]|uniref:KTSC domain-containing protein n=2 Tax=Verticiella sediminum TaxID=1247510 RepID=A0A556ACY6_9BURK|nr:hypothetical protein [Verticiella sediminum]TSH90756.1 hypothetical protein FOZ76_20120 [Verticiella sediminum]
MQRYRNLSGKSGVVAYAVGQDHLLVQFVDGAIYRYDASAPGAAHVARMQQLAQRGRGLATYISRHVGKNFADKLDTP